MNVDDLRAGYLADLSWYKAMFDPHTCKRQVVVHEFVDVLVARSLSEEPYDLESFRRSVLSVAFKETGLRLDPKYGASRVDKYLANAFDRWKTYCKSNKIDIGDEE